MKVSRLIGTRCIYKARVAHLGPVRPARSRTSCTASVPRKTWRYAARMLDSIGLRPMRNRSALLKDLVGQNNSGVQTFQLVALMCSFKTLRDRDISEISKRAFAISLRSFRQGPRLSSPAEVPFRECQEITESSQQFVRASGKRTLRNHAAHEPTYETMQTRIGRKSKEVIRLQINIAQRISLPAAARKSPTQGASGAHLTSVTFGRSHTSQ